jgi:hypothetical protein
MNVECDRSDHKGLACEQLSRGDVEDKIVSGGRGTALKDKTSFSPIICYSDSKIIIQLILSRG